MNKYFLGLMSLALLGGSTLLGQAPTAGQKGEPIPAPKGEPIPAPIKEIPMADPACPSGSCQGGGCQKTKTICCPEHYTKEQKKVVYTFGCEKKCLPGCTFCHLLGGHGCDHCDHAKCGHAIHVRYLVKKVQICEHDAVKCNPVEVPACGHGHGRRCANGACSGDSPVIETEQPVVTPPVNVVVPTTNK
jgi:hypothetical protein